MRERGRRNCWIRLGWGTGCITTPFSYRVGSSSGCRWRGLLRISRVFCLPTSPRAILMRRPARRSRSFFLSLTARRGRRWSSLRIIPNWRPVPNALSGSQEAISLPMRDNKIFGPEGGADGKGPGDGGMFVGRGPGVEEFAGGGPGVAWYFRMAWRDSRRNRGRLFLFISSIVLGIAALVATLSFGYNLREDVDDQAKELVGADLVIRGRHGISDSLRSMKVFAGALHSEQKSMASMVAFPRTQSSRLVQLIGISGDYPYYGKIETRPASAAMDFRRKRAALVDQTLMLEFGARVGDSIRVGTIDLVIAGALIKIPGRNQLSLTVAAPVCIPLRYIDSAGLVQKGSRIESEVYYQFKPGTDMSALMETLGPELE